MPFGFEQTRTWESHLRNAFGALDAPYQHFLATSTAFFPKPHTMFNAFKTLPLEKTRYILFGQDPYPRCESAIGYAFIDGAVKSLFETGGLSKEVNKATSLRNFMKMLLVCEGELNSSTLTKEWLREINTTSFIQTIDDLRKNFEANGVLLLNTSLIFEHKEGIKTHAKAFAPFMKRLLDGLDATQIELILFGKVAGEIAKYDPHNRFKKHTFVHPYNLSFIGDENVHALFSPMQLLRKRK